MHKNEHGPIHAEYCTTGKYVSEKAPMCHQRRKIDSFVLLYGIRGTLYIADGDSEYALSPNDYLLLAPHREHAGTRQSPPGVSYYWCHFHLPGEYVLYRDASGRECIFFGKESAVRMPMYGCLTDVSKIHLLFHQLIDSSRTALPFSQQICRNFLEILLYEIASSFASDNRTVKTAAVQNIVEWIRLNASQIGSVGDVADHFGYNSEYLTTMLRRATGKSLVQHISESRIEYAKKLLRTTNQTVSQIAGLCGLADEKYFSRVFKKNCDLTPTAFRNTCTNQHMNDR